MTTTRYVPNIKKYHPVISAIFGLGKKSKSSAENPAEFFTKNERVALYIDSFADDSHVVSDILFLQDRIPAKNILLITPDSYVAHAQISQEIRIIHVDVSNTRQQILLAKCDLESFNPEIVILRVKNRTKLLKQILRSSQSHSTISFGTAVHPPLCNYIFPESDTTLSDFF